MEEGYGHYGGSVRPFEELVDEAAAADVGGWGFEWLDGRAREERPPWGYARLLAERLARVGSALDIDTGGGEVVAEAPTLPPRMAVSEGWPPNAERARRLLGPRGVEVVETTAVLLPFDDESFELVTSRHPVRPEWVQLHRVLQPGGHYFAQHVGPASAWELIEFFLGPQPRRVHGRDADVEMAAARQAGLVVERLETARCRMEFHDVGAVVWILRKCPWWVPDFTVDRYRDRLRELDAGLRRGEPFVAHSTRHLVELRKPAA